MTDWHKIFIVSSLSFLGGAWLGTIFVDDWTVGVLAGLIFLTLILLFGRILARQPAFIYFGLIILSGFLLGLGRTYLVKDYSGELDGFLGQKVSFRAEITAEPDERETLTRLTVRPESYGAKIQITAERYPPYRIGDLISVTGKLNRPDTFSTSTNNFDYGAYLAKDGIYYQTYKPQLSLFKRPTVGIIVWLAELKSQLLGKIAQILPEPESSLLAGILLGAKKALGTEITNDFRAAGVSHILVLSGYNITFVAENVLAVFWLLPRVLGGVVGFAVMIAFGLLAGGGAVVWRAVLMALIAFYAKLTGRLFDVAAAILFSAVALVAYRPNSLTADLGFQLSIMALIGIVYVSPWLAERFFGWIKSKFWRELIASTFGAQLAVLPLLWQATGQVSVLGFISNLAILPLIPSAMGVGATALGLGFISTILAWPVSVVSLILLKTILWLAHWFASWPLSGLTWNYSSWWLVIIYYLSLFRPVVKYWQTKIASESLLRVIPGLTRDPV
ncbi:MAG: ComEC/Rec2 family competence protein [Candidatus Vogelbacteria bacterium]|nr:ComEC/Rec2 family competence protein [Candidatus Vogelbacteria bacterium]